MKLNSEGKINEFISVAGNSLYPAYIIKGSKKNLMIDAGINLFGPLYLKTLDEILGDKKKLDYLFVTHSHYDHLGSLPYLKKKLPQLITGGFPYINNLLKKESVLAWMNKLSEIQREMFKDIVEDEKVTIETMELYLNLREEDKIDLGGLTCEVYETPGHTKDCLSYFIPEIKALFPGEIVGVPDWPTGEKVEVEFLSSYQDYLNSIKRLIDLKPKFMGLGHKWFFTDEDVTNFLEKSYQETIKYKSFLEDQLAKVDNNLEKARDEITRIEYDEPGTRFQERSAYLANLEAQLKHILKLKKN